MQGHGILPTILADANKRLGGEDVLDMMKIY